MIYGYARVSSTDQNLDRQLEAFGKVGVEKVYSDKISGKNFNREQYQKMKYNLQKGDLLYIKSIDRLGRNYDMIIDEWRDITHNIGANIVVIDMPLLDTRDKDKGLTGKFISDLVLQILSYVAETERNNIKQRQSEGIRIAKEKGIHMGRPKFELSSKFKELAENWRDNKISILDALKQTNMNKSTFYKYAKLLGIQKSKNISKPTKKPKYEYHLTGNLIDKYYSTKNELSKDLCVCFDTINKCLKGEKTIIDRMGLKIEKVWRGK